MRIVHVPHAYTPAVGGAESYCRGLSECLAASGHDVHVLTAGMSNAEAFYELGHPAAGPSHEEIGGVHVDRIPYGDMVYRSAGLISARGMSNAGATRRVIDRSRRRFCTRLQSAVARLAPDVVLALPHLFPNVRCLLSAASDTPLVIAPMLHERDPNWPFDEVKQAVARADGVVALTSHEAERLIDAYGAAPDRIAIVPPGITPSTTSAARQSATPPRIAYAGRLTTGKNLDLLFAAMRRVWQVLPDVQLVLAGASGDIDIEAQRLAAAEVPDGEKDRIIVIDAPTDGEMRAILEEASAVVSPSLRESFGIVILEAWAVGTPVVAVDTPVARSIVSQGQDGLLAAPSPSAFADAMLLLLRDAPLAAELGAAGRAKALDTYTWSRSAESLLSLYRRLQTP